MLYHLPLRSDKGRQLFFAADTLENVAARAVRWSGDLDAVLISPDGTTVELATNVCGNVDDWENVTFDDEAGIAVEDACGPFPGPPALTGSVRPEGLLSDFDGAK